MKISEMNNDQATEAMIRIAEPFRSICDDDDLKDILERMARMRNEEGTPVIKAVGNLIPDFIKCALKKHKQDLYEIIGALGGIPTAEVGKMNFKQTIQLVKDSYDDTLRDFFTQSTPSTETTGG